MNWTDDSWTRQENVIAVVDSPAIAKAYRIDFDQLWTTGDVEQSGFVDPRWRRRRPRLVHAGPRRGPLVAHRADDPPREAARAHLLAGDHDRPGARHARAGDRRREVDLAGCVDATQIREVDPPVADERERLVEAAAARAVMAGPFTGKESTPYGERHGARLHAREGPRLRRHGVRRLVQPLALAARRTRRTCSRSRTPRSPTGWRPSSTRCPCALPARHQRCQWISVVHRPAPFLEPRARRAGRRRACRSARARSARHPRAGRAPRRRSASGRDGR